MASRVDDFVSGCALLAGEITKDEQAGKMTAGTAAALLLRVRELEQLYRTALSA